MSNSKVQNSNIEEKNDRSAEVHSGEERKRAEDLNALFQGMSYDLNRLFPDEGTRRLLHDIRRNKRDIERFIKKLDFEEE